MIIITQNEAQNIAACLESVQWADEIVVVDSGSTDATEAICRSYSQLKFCLVPWQGFGPQKNQALDRATGDWVLSLDADEIVTPALATEIRAIVQDSDCDGYWVRRKNLYREQWIRYSGWWPDEILRLFRRGKGRFNERLVHESVAVAGHLGRLSGCIEHRSFRSAGDFLAKAQSYSTLGAEQLLNSGRSGSTAQAFGRSLATFFKTYLLKGGILDGRAGLLIAFSNAVGVFYRYMKRLELDDPASKGQR